MRKQAYYVLMKRLAAVALIVAGFAIPACAQRATAHGGFSVHGGPAVHGGFRASAPGRVSRPSGFAPGRSPVATRAYRRGIPGNPIARSGSPDRRRHRRPYVPAYRTGISYGLAPWPGWIGPEVLGYPDDSGNGDAQAAASDATAGDATGGYDQQPPEQDQPAFRRPYEPPTGLSRPPAADTEEAVTFLYKDGRPPEQIRNYILTRTTLYVQDQPRRTIPVDQLDLAATEKANRAAGVVFQLPNATR